MTMLFQEFQAFVFIQAEYQVHGGPPQQKAFSYAHARGLKSSTLVVLKR